MGDVLGAPGGRLPKAIEEALAEGHIREVADLLKQHGQTLLDDGYADPILRWFKGLPDGRPLELSLLEAQASAFLGQVERAEPMLDALLEQVSPESKLWPVLLSHAAHLQFRHGDVSKADRYWKRGRAVHPGDPGLLLGDAVMRVHLGRDVSGAIRDVEHLERFARGAEHRRLQADVARALVFFVPLADGNRHRAYRVLTSVGDAGWGRADTAQLHVLGPALDVFLETSVPLVPL